jgi:hypothetical protein
VSTVARAAGGEEDAALLLAVLPAMHFGWGFGTLAGVLRFGLPVAALRHVAGCPERSTAEDHVEPVYAPSLHGVDA